MRMMRSNLQVERAAQQRRCWVPGRLAPPPAVPRVGKGGKGGGNRAGGRELWRAGTGGLSGNSRSSPLLGVSLLGVTLFWWLPLALSAIIGGSQRGLALVSVWLFTNFAILLPSSVLPSAALGALGTWLLVVLRERGQGKRETRLTGMAYGAVAGMVMSVLARVQEYPFSAFGGGLTLVMGAVQSGAGGDSILPFIGSTVAGGGTGVLLGLFIACRVRAGALPQPLTTASSRRADTYTDILLATSPVILNR